MCRFTTLCVADPIWGVCRSSYTLEVILGRVRWSFLWSLYEVVYCADVVTLENGKRMLKYRKLLQRY